MKAWQKGTVILVSILLLSYFVKIDYPVYEVNEIKFNRSYSDDEINTICDIVEIRLPSAFPDLFYAFCEPKSSDTI